MKRRKCTNCQSTWSSLEDRELEGPHTCPRCGDLLGRLQQDLFGRGQRAQIEVKGEVRAAA
jgi:hypothetical protein